MAREEVSVSVADLELIRAALNSAHMAHMAMDLADQYRKLSNRQQYSALTKALEGALGVVEDYVAAVAERDGEVAD